MNWTIKKRKEAVVYIHLRVDTGQWTSSTMGWKRWYCIYTVYSYKWTSSTMGWKSWYCIYTVYTYEWTSSTMGWKGWYCVYCIYTLTSGHPPPWGGRGSRCSWRRSPCGTPSRGSPSHLFAYRQRYFKYSALHAIWAYLLLNSGSMGCYRWSEYTGIHPVLKQPFYKFPD